MPTIAYGAAAYRRTNGNLPELRLVNMFLEAAPTSEAGTVLLSRKGLSESVAVGTGPVTGVFSKPGVFGGDTFTVSGGVLYRGTTLVGTVGGTGPVSFAASDTELAVTAGETLHRYDGSTLATVSFPDTANVRHVAFADGLFLAARDDTQKWYFSAVLDADTWGALDFASAESSPDRLLQIVPLGDFLLLFGEGTIEEWGQTGDADLPYSPSQGRTIAKGLYDTGCVVELDNTVLWIGSDGIVYRLGVPPERISDHGIEERIKASSSVSCFGFVDEGHSFFCVRLDAGTWAYDVATGNWSELASYGRNNFRGRCATMTGQTVLLGDDEEGTLWTLDGWSDDGGPLERLFTAAFPLKGGALTVDNLNIEANVGWTTLLVGQGADPVAELRSSRDGGATWGNWREAPLGQQGQYRTRTQWRRCGMFDAPGGLFEVRTSDPVPFRVSSVTINEAGGGRSR